MTIQLSRKEKTYIDISLAFEPSPITADLTLLKNERAINNAIKNIILFMPLEVTFNRNIGSQVTSYLFDVVDYGSAGLLKLEIERAINYNEPRVALTSLSQIRGYYNLQNGLINRNHQDEAVYVEPQPERNQFYVSITYEIVGTDKIQFVEQILTPTR